MDPWSKVDHSRIIREASMVEEKLLEVDPSFNRVPGRGLLELPILEARRRWNRGEIAKKGYVFRVSATGDKYRRSGAVRGGTRGPCGPLARPHSWPRREGAWGAGGSPL